MNGLTFLSEQLVTENIYLPGWSFSGLVAAIGFLFVLIILITTIDDIDLGLFIIGSFVAIIMICYSIVSFRTANVEEKFHYEYKVLIDDSVSFIEFNEKYEVVNQEGTIYTVIEREEKVGE
jgi:hypothetical protein